MRMTGIVRIILLIASSCLSLIQASGPEPTVIFLGANGRPMVSNQNEGVYSPSSNYASLGSAASIISTLKSRDSSSSGGGSLYSLIRERLGERLQERSSKNRPRIIVIPQAAKNQQQQQQQPQQGQQQQAFQSSVSPSYMSYSSPYASVASASSSYPSYAPYSYSYPNSYPFSAYGMSPYVNPYASSYQYSGGQGSSSSMQPSASTQLASYAYAPSNFLSNILSTGSSAASSLLSKSTYSSLYPYLAQALALYPF